SRPECAMSRFTPLGVPALALLPLLIGCGDSTGPATSSLTAISPAPNATSVSTGTTIVLTFQHPMSPGMAQYFDLHQGGVTGPTVPMSCTWSPDATTLTCTPSNPLTPGTQYTMHVGAGMTDSAGHRMGMGDWTTRGGTWATSGMMGGTHDGQPTGMMGAGWKHDGHYGMTFTFTTA